MTMLVVKCGGAEGVDHAAICQDAAGVVARGAGLILVHGGSAEIDRLARRLGQTPRALTSPSGTISRHTDPEALETLTMAMAGKINPQLVARLIALGVPALGLAGVDGALIRAERKPAIKAVVDGRTTLVRDDLTGHIRGVNSALLLTLTGAGLVPVVSPPAIDAERGILLNVDADRLAAALAAAGGASELVLLTNTPGLLRDPQDPQTLLRCMPAGGFAEALELARGRMRLKLIAAREALLGGVPRVVIADGRAGEPITRALGGEGTVIGRDALGEVG